MISEWWDNHVPLLDLDNRQRNEYSSATGTVSAQTYDYDGVDIASISETTAASGNFVAAKNRFTLERHRPVLRWHPREQ